MPGLDLTPVEGGKHARRPVSELPAYIADTAQEAYEFCKINPERLSAQFETQAEADQFLSDMRDYAYQADPRLVLTGNTTQKGSARFRIELYVKPDSPAA